MLITCMYVSQWIGYHKYIRGTLSNSSIAASKDKKKSTKKQKKKQVQLRNTETIIVYPLHPSVRPYVECYDQTAMAFLFSRDF